MEPKYQELLAEDIPVAESNGVKVKVIAGEAMGIRSPVYTRTPTMYLDFTLEAGARLTQAVPTSYNAFIYIMEGEGVFLPNSAIVKAHYCLVLGPGDSVNVWNNSPSQTLRFVLIGGEPINEPVVQYGPFVMNSHAEIEQTFDDYQHSKNGFELANYWRSH